MGPIKWQKTEQTGQVSEMERTRPGLPCEYIGCVVLVGLSLLASNERDGRAQHTRSSKALGTPWEDAFMATFSVCYAR